MGRIFDHPYRVVRYDQHGDMIDELAQRIHFDLARACQRKAAKICPDDEVAVQHGIRVMVKMKGTEQLWGPCPVFQTCHRAVQASAGRPAYARNTVPCFPCELWRQGVSL
ncbi:hypothetical protein BCF46_3719 [Litoreibacter meonggei]|uniref:Uncharacterized protein n=1 Tax=Litoreibacter meonggei TaxID=1049199 RepID=A0A497VEI3_9RHOB|nr:hypothetical protein [Litoreibacter meonggei]RLJ40647.1 hypothetical protein BCF46_3719 [Litoreibacter meonggei]